MFNKGKAIVVSKIEDKKIPINLGDEIIRIDDFDFTTIKNELKPDLFLLRPIRRGS